MLYFSDRSTQAGGALYELLFAFRELGIGSSVPPTHSPEQPCKATQEVGGGPGPAGSPWYLPCCSISSPALQLPSQKRSQLGSTAHSHYLSHTDKVNEM